MNQIDLHIPDSISDADLLQLQEMDDGATQFRFRDFTFTSDPVTHFVKRKENWLPILPEEQPFVWSLLEKPLQAHCKNVEGGQANILDIGSGTGFFSLLSASILGANVSPIDKNAKAIQYLSKAIQQFSQSDRPSRGIIRAPRKEHYGPYSYESHAADVIFLHPPSLIYPQKLEYRVPLFARSGWDGQMEFQSQLETALEHLRDDGIIVFLTMLGGNGKHPAMFEKRPAWLRPARIEYTNILPPISSETFLQKLYPGPRYQNFIKHYQEKYPSLHYCCGMIQKRKLPSLTSVEHKVDIENIRDWKDRLTYYQQIPFH